MIAMTTSNSMSVKSPFWIYDLRFAICDGEANVWSSQVIWGESFHTHHGTIMN